MDYHSAPQYKQSQYIISIKHRHLKSHTSEMSARQQAGGHKANLSNPNTSEESKQHSREVLDGELGEQAQSQEHSHEGKNPGNGSFPVHLSLVYHFLPRFLCLSPLLLFSTYPLTILEDGLTIVAGGYKATLKNPNVSDEAKQHAEEQLKHL